MPFPWYGGSDMMRIHALEACAAGGGNRLHQLREREHIRELAIKNQYFMRALVESDSRGIVTVDQTGRIVEANSTATRKLLLNFRPAARGKSFERAWVKLSLSRHISRKVGVPGTRNPCPAQQGRRISRPSTPIHEQRRAGGRFCSPSWKKEMMRMAVEMTGAHAHFTFESILRGERAYARLCTLPTSRLEARPQFLLSGETGTDAGAVRAGYHNGPAPAGTDL